MQSNTNNTKKCSVCNNEWIASPEYFVQDKRNKNGLGAECRKCNRLSSQKYNSEHKEKRRIYAEKYYLENKDKIAKRIHDRYESNKDRELQRSRAYYIKNKGRLSEKGKNRRKQNRDKVLAYYRDYYNKHRIDLLKNRRLYNQKNRNKIKEYPSRNSIGFKLYNTLRVRLYRAIKQRNAKKSLNTMDLTGCSIDELQSYLESKFLSGMSWDNYGYGDNKWHIDHIIPCAYFDLTKPEEQKKCFHYTNLQPLWQPANLSKNSYYEGRRIRREK